MKPVGELRTLIHIITFQTHCCVPAALLPIMVLSCLTKAIIEMYVKIQID